MFEVSFLMRYCLINSLSNSKVYLLIYTEVTREFEHFEGREIGQLWRSIDLLMLKALPQKSKVIIIIFIVINNNNKYTLVSRIFR